MSNMPKRLLKCPLCFRSDGSFTHMEGLAMVFKSEPTGKDEGLYTCRASFYHHTAAVKIQVEVTSEDRQLGKFPLPSCIFHEQLTETFLFKKMFQKN